MKRMILLLVLSVAALSAQVPDPPYDQPGAQENAEMRFGMNYAVPGLMLPPIGWNCTPLLVWYGDVPTLAAYCEPDPVLVEQQQRETDEWLQHLVEQSRRLFSRARRN